jgi:hypothetical protein
MYYNDNINNFGLLDPEHFVPVLDRALAPQIGAAHTLQKIPFWNLQYQEIYTVCTGFLHV